LIPNAHIELPKTEAELRAVVEQIHTPTLDAFRARMKTTKTSELLVLLITGPEEAAKSIYENDATDAPLDAVAAALFLALVDEIDRRLPAPKAVEPATFR